VSWRRRWFEPDLLIRLPQRSAQKGGVNGGPYRGVKASCPVAAPFPTWIGHFVETTEASSHLARQAPSGTLNLRWRRGARKLNTSWPLYGEVECRVGGRRAAPQGCSSAGDLFTGWDIFIGSTLNPKTAR
jgi:hypothetical protein